MKISAIPPREMLYQYVHVKEKKTERRENAVSSDKVEITEEAKTFSLALKAAKDKMEAGGVNADRIERIKAQIENNTYHVPGVLVAGKMLGE
ncbi:MAG: flagellar biosynthesis anti-sigma factor FlgM [Clostridiales bacterium]|jgi:anti-sigma28 factor (negative regulator of flagellin synthesis)|nr:flagellar biosynthesis anti-sigma factor FlgM [Clostridiales bacterium]